MSAAFDLHAEAWADGLRRERERTVSEWADQFRMLDRRSSSYYGRWYTSRTPYLRGIMDALSPQHPAERVVFMKGTQVGGTEAGNNWVGYTIHRNPGPMLMVLPTVEVAKRISQQRIAPMLQSTTVLKGKVADVKSRHAANTLSMKEYEGGLLIMTGANSAAGLRSMPARDIFCDEIDEYPEDVDGQGDPIELAEARQATYPDRKSFHVSTPTIKGLSRIEKEFNASDQRRYFVPCPKCGHMDWLRWENIRWTEKDPETARLYCVGCKALLEERFKTEMLAGGEWRATAKSVDGTVGFHLSALYSPLGWKSWAKCVAQFLKAKLDRSKLKTWVNTVLGETWEEKGDSVQATTLRERVERYAAEVPHGVGALIAAVDVQGDRLEVAVYGFGDAEESWLVAFSVIPGDPEGQTVWYDLDKFLAQRFEHESGRRVSIIAAVVDTGGINPERAYRFVAARQNRRIGPRVYGVKGGSVAGLPLVDRPSMSNRYRIPLYVLCVDAGKEIVMARLQIARPADWLQGERLPGFIHLPDWIDDEFLDQLTAEKAIRRYMPRRGLVKVWEKLRERNEALDLTVYALAGLYIAGPGFIRGLPERAAALSQPIATAEEPQAEEPMTAEEPRELLPRRPRRSWVDGWKDG